jgi:NTP pyrophosphatase (non-canonical NTP hydrolase)
VIRRQHGSGNQVHCFRDDHELWQEILRSREAADRKHGPASIERIGADSGSWLTMLVEEVGEVANALTYDGPADGLRAELIDVAAVVTAWIAAVDEVRS